MFFQHFLFGWTQLYDSRYSDVYISICVFICSISICSRYVYIYIIYICLCYIYMFISILSICLISTGTLSETNSSHLKMDGWNTIFSLWGKRPIFRCELLVLGSVFVMIILTWYLEDHPSGFKWLGSPLSKHGY